MVNNGAPEPEVSSASSAQMDVAPKDALAAAARVIRELLSEQVDSYRSTSASDGLSIDVSNEDLLAPFTRLHLTAAPGPKPNAALVEVTITKSGAGVGAIGRNICERQVPAIALLIVRAVQHEISETSKPQLSL